MVCGVWCVVWYVVWYVVWCVLWCVLWCVVWYVVWYQLAGRCTAAQSTVATPSAADSSSPRAGNNDIEGPPCVESIGRGKALLAVGRIIRGRIKEGRIPRLPLRVQMPAALAGTATAHASSVCHIYCFMCHATQAWDYETPAARTDPGSRVGALARRGREETYPPSTRATVGSTCS